MIAEEICKMISGKWTQIPHGWRICLPTSAIRETARRMLIGGARFCALVALPQGDEALRISWNWDVNGVLLSVESIIARDVAELCQERVALFGGCTREPAYGVLGGWTRRQFAVADRERRNQQKPLVIVRQRAHMIGQ